MSDEMNQISEASESSQDSYTESFLSDLGEENVTYVPQDTWEDDPEPDNTQPVKQEETPATDDTAVDETGKTPEPKKDTDFDFVVDSNGEQVFDGQGALDFFKDDTKAGKDDFDFIEKQDAPAVAPNSATDTPEQPTDPRSTMTQNMLYFKDVYAHYRELGYGETESIALAERDINNDIDKHFQKQEFNSLREELKAEKDAIRAEKEMVEIRPKAMANINAVIQNGKWGSQARLEKALFNPDIAGDFILREFKRDTDGKTYKSTEEYQSAIQDWFMRAASDSGRLNDFVTVAKAKILMRNWDSIVENIQNVKKGVQQSQKKANFAQDRGKPREPQLEQFKDGVNDDVSWLDKIANA